MRRREFIGLIGGAAAWPHLARAQQGERMRRIGFLGPAPASSYLPRVDALRAGLRDLGYIEGKNVAVEYRWGEGRNDRLPSLIAELVRRQVSVIVTLEPVVEKKK